LKRGKIPNKAVDLSLELKERPGLAALYPHEKEQETKGTELWQHGRGHLKGKGRDQPFFQSKPWDSK